MYPSAAVGIGSQGIQVCEGTLKYYHDWSGYADDIQETYACIESLRKTLKSLDDILLSGFSSILATWAQERLAICQYEIKQSGKNSKKLGKDAPVEYGQESQAAVRRLTYPFSVALAISTSS